MYFCKMQDKLDRWLKIWLLAGIFMILIQAILGGVTRLTGSGLSITEWKPIVGVLPPLNETQWQQEFDKYKNIPQFQLLNHEMTIDGFKKIFFWEWFHRLWGRALGIVFFIPFVYFIIKKKMSLQLAGHLLLAMLFGAVQGLVGWIMVSTGLKDNVYVAHTNLTQHLLLACGLIAYLIWIYMKVAYPPRSADSDKKIQALQKLPLVLLITVVVQLAYGGFMAGQHAALDCTTYPLMQGKFIPQNFINESIPLLANFIDNKMTIQFIHRMLPWLIVLLMIFIYKRSQTAHLDTREKNIIYILLLNICLQILLGIITLMSSNRGHVPVLWGVLHQFFGILFFCEVVMLNYFRYLSHDDKDWNKINP